MKTTEPQKWLMLIHQIPPKPTALRVKIWRRLQRLGAVAVKQSVYLLPLREQAREDLSWLLKEIVAGGGDGSVCEARFVEGLTDAQLVNLFQTARKADYEKLMSEVNEVLAHLSDDVAQAVSRDLFEKSVAQLPKLKQRLQEIEDVDFFQAVERTAAELQLKELSNFLTGQSAPLSATRMGITHLAGKTWVTRANLFVDRIACGWLVRRFVDPAATFKFVADSAYAPADGEIRFDMYDGEYTHEGDRCTFEVMRQRLRIEDHALIPLTEVVHDIDLKDGKFNRSETDGFNALLTGLVAGHPDDDQRMREGFRLFENLYTYYQRQK